VVLPAMKPSVEASKVRESARQINTLVVNAQARAAVLGRPAGIRLQRDVLPGQNVTDACYQVSLVESPQPYAGDVAHATATITWNTGGGSITGTVGLNNATMADVLIRPGDRIRFNYQGRYYPIMSSTGSQFTIQPADATLPPPQYPQPVPYQVVRQPIKSRVAPVELERQTFVDLMASGLGVSNEFATGEVSNGPIVITFGPGGGIEAIYFYSVDETAPPSFVRPQAPIFLLVRNLPKSSDTVAMNRPGHQDVGAKWVMINHLTGLVVTADNLGASGSDLTTARLAAREGQNTGGS